MSTMKGIGFGVAKDVADDDEEFEEPAGTWDECMIPSSYIGSLLCCLDLA